MSNPLRDLARWVTRVRPAVIEAGPAAGLRIDLRRASAKYTDGTNERPLQDAMAQFLAPGGVLYDIGANVGFFSLLGARLVGGKGRVVAFEPEPKNADAVRRNASLNDMDHITVIEAAVGAAPGKAELLVADHPGGATIADAGTPRDVRERAVVDVVCIDAMVRKEQIPPPTFIKVDTEGAEEAVLRGLELTARRFTPVIVCEVDDATHAGVESKARDVRERLASWGYAATVLPPSYVGIDWNVMHILGRVEGERSDQSGRVG